MSRYIDAEQCRRKISDERNDDKRWNEALNRACRIVVESPAVDVAPVVHAHPERVIEKQGYFRKHFREYCCSVCKHEIRSWYRYCCYCGARIDEVTE